MYDAARGVITQYERHVNGEPLNGQELIVKLLELYFGFKGLVKFAGINEPSAANGRTALHGACEVGDEAMLAWLCSENFGQNSAGEAMSPPVSVNLKDKAGLTALDVAVEHGHTACVEFLRNRGGKPGAEIPSRWWR
eukprot:gnl/TRDRNA2_/TRDRNA2_157919_c0_seq1.p2 gnl/TRDRNA2_/TRDRNA2_157919_c0~~gnl/TRDRNA2_/TRDRNA2_157919_c0_seq1.p2  ORF type:complete len:137 (+),score=12.81 gnl/TRDRNA2_/TRDRNA2_157919_c0_seq1:94-504(+)